MCGSSQRKSLLADAGAQVHADDKTVLREIKNISSNIVLPQSRGSRASCKAAFTPKTTTSAFIVRQVKKSSHQRSNVVDTDSDSDIMPLEAC